LAPVYGCRSATLLLIIIFSIMLPNTFPTMLNLLDPGRQGDHRDPLLGGDDSDDGRAHRLDRVGYAIVLWHIWRSRCDQLGTTGASSSDRAVAGAFPRLLNGLLVEIARIDSFIATLAPARSSTRSPLVHPGPADRRVLPTASPRSTPGCRSGIPIAAFYVLILAVSSMDCQRVSSIGRSLYAIGANPRAAELNGIPSRRFNHRRLRGRRRARRLAGLLLAARLRIGQASGGLEYLLPALVGAFLGSDHDQPVASTSGHIVGVASWPSHLRHSQQIGGAFFIEPLFNGVTC